MDCPRCKLALRETQYEGVTVDLCDNCWGIWLDTGELKDVIDSQQLQFSDAERRQISGLRGAPATPTNTEPAACPRCGRVMDQVHSDVAVPLVIDRCPDHGVWLDTGEIKAVQVVAEQSADLHRLLLQKLGLARS